VLRNRRSVRLFSRARNHHLGLVPRSGRTRTKLGAALDGIESLILAQACAGIDIESPAYIEAVETAVEKCMNFYD
jgi:hypothetical protein